MRECREYSLTLVIAVVVVTLVFVRLASRDASGIDLESFAAAQMPGLDANPGLLALRNGIGETPLHFLAVETDRDGVAWLHARGADLNTRNDFDKPDMADWVRTNLR